jgi:photosynthetic reaction center cytochrome c subunit
VPALIEASAREERGMSQQQSAFPPLNDDAKFNLVAGSMAADNHGFEHRCVWWIWSIVQPPAPKPIPVSTVYNKYDPSGNHLKPTSLTAMQKYITENEQPKNAQVLKGWNTKQISNYMVAQVAGGLKVDCSYCHNVNNFADDSNPNKVKARAMLLMSGDLDRSFVSKLPVSVGGYNITCATCHNGKPKFETYPRQIQNTLPNDYRLPLDREYPGGLVITGRKDKSLDEVESQSIHHVPHEFEPWSRMYLLSQRTLLPSNRCQRRWARPKATCHLDVADRQAHQ